MEEHGPYLPSYADGYQNERYTADIAAAIARRPGWAAVVFPAIPLGSNGANTIGGRFPFPGTYAVRPETLRAIFMDLGAEFGEQGFRWIFLIHMHGAPDHNQALDDAGEYFRDVYGGRMINLAGLDTGSDPGVEAMKANASREAVDEEGVGGHAGLLETSRVMAVRPDLVPSSVASAPSVSAHGELSPPRVPTGPATSVLRGMRRQTSDVAFLKLIREGLCRSRCAFSTARPTSARLPGSLR
jgi:creatinine amidohydrolase/Fe(II)-dependent formamide hydrolase-like protein